MNVMSEQLGVWNKSPLEMAELSPEEAARFEENVMPILREWRSNCKWMSQNLLLNLAENMLYLAKDERSYFTCAEALIGVAADMGLAYIEVEETTTTIPDAFLEYYNPHKDFEDDQITYTDRGAEIKETEREYAVKPLAQLHKIITAATARVKEIPPVATMGMLLALIGIMAVVVGVSVWALMNPAFSGWMFADADIPVLVEVIAVLITFALLFTMGLTAALVWLVCYTLVGCFQIIRIIAAVLLVGGVVTVLLVSICSTARDLFSKERAAMRERQIAEAEAELVRIRTFIGGAFSSRRKWQSEDLDIQRNNFPRNMDWHIAVWITFGRYADQLQKECHDLQKLIDQARQGSK